METALSQVRAGRLRRVVINWRRHWNQLNISAPLMRSCWYGNLLSANGLNDIRGSLNTDRHVVDRPR